MLVVEAVIDNTLLNSITLIFGLLLRQIFISCQY